MHSRFLVLGVIATLFGAGSAALATTHTVRPDGTGDFPTIQAAVDAAQTGDEIVLTSGVYLGEGNRGVLVAGKAVTVRSETRNPTDCQVDCERRDRGFRFFGIDTGTSVLEGIEITRGGNEDHQNNDLGGGVSIVSADVIVRNCDILDNTALVGGGVFLQWSLSTIEGCLFACNVASQDPGGAILSAASTVIRSCTFVENAAGPGRDGAAIACAGFSYAHSTVTVESSVVARSSEGSGVLCHNEYSTVELSCCNLFDNAGGDWVGCVADQAELRGNFSSDPLFCSDDSFELQPESPCAPPGPTGCGLIGARPVGCDVVSREDVSWGRVKALHREGRSE